MSREGRFTEAESALLQALKTAESLGDVRRASALSELGYVYQNQAKYVKAEQCYLRSLAISERQKGIDHPETAFVVSDLMSLYVRTRQYGKAERLRPRSTAYVATLGADRPERVWLLAALGALAFAQGRYPEAEDCLRKQLVTTERIYGPESEVAADTLMNIAMVLLKTDRRSAALAPIERALNLAERTGRPDHPRMADILLTRSMIFAAEGRAIEAGLGFKRALAIAEKSFGPEHPMVALILDEYSLLLRGTGQKREAKQMSKRAAAIHRADARHHPARNTIDVSALLEDNAGRGR